MNATIPGERAEILDILRGFAIFGIYLANSITFSALSILPDPVKAGFPTAPLDSFFMALQTIFVEGKFYSLFSLLFGLGFSIILVRNQSRSRYPLLIFYRRLLILAIIGLTHMLLLWDGEILLFYAIMGLLLPLFRNVSGKTLLITAAACILAPIILDILRLTLIPDLAPFLQEKAFALDGKNGISTDPDIYSYYLYKEGSGYGELRNWLESGFFYRFHYLINSGRVFKVFGMFLLGYYIGRRRIHAEPVQFIGMITQVRNIGFLIGIPMNLALYLTRMDSYSIPGHWLGLLETTSYALGIVPLSLAYTATIVLMSLRDPAGSRLRYLTPVGRMALTNYLLQTVISILIYYNLGLGLGTKIGYTYVLLISAIVLATQMLISHLWFRVANYGPAEWVWRMATYGKKIPLFRAGVIQEPVRTGAPGS